MKKVEAEMDGGLQDVQGDGHLHDDDHDQLHDQHDEGDLPEIVVTGRPLRDVATDALAALVAANSPPAVFVRRGKLVRVRTDENDRPFIETLSEASLRHHLARAADFMRIRKDGAPQHMSPPADVVSDVLAFKRWPKIPPLEAVTEVPVLRPDGSVVDRPGYDRKTRLVYLPPPGTVLPRIPSGPTAEEVRQARETITDVISDFPFTTVASAANTVALLLTAVVRPAIRGPVPLALIDKPKRGTGASLIAQVVQLVTTGKMTELMTAPSHDEEWRKKITAALVNGSTIMFFDNVEDPLSSSHLAAALTAPEWSDRILGRSEMVTAPNRATWIATGNNLKVGGDMARRSYWIRLDAGVDRPWQRDGFRHPDLLAYVLTHRGPILAALLTLARHWFASGCPEAVVPKLGSYELWTRIVGGILATAGIEGFLGNLNELYDQVDEDETAWVTFLTTWFTQYGESAVTAATVADEVRTEGSPLRGALPDDLAETLALEVKNPKVSFVRRLGKALAKRVDGVFGTLKLHKVGKDGNTNALRWAVRPAIPAPGFPGFPGLFSADPASGIFRNRRSPAPATARGRGMSNKEIVVVVALGLETAP